MLLSSQCLLKVLSVTISCYSFLAANDIFTRYLSCTNMSCNAAHIDCSRAVSSVTQILFLLLVLPPAGMTEWLQLYSNDLPAVPHFLQHRLFPIPPACTHFSSAVKWKGEKSDQILSTEFSPKTRTFLEEDCSEHIFNQPSSEMMSSDLEAYFCAFFFLVN